MMRNPAIIVLLVAGSSVLSAGVAATFARSEPAAPADLAERFRKESRQTSAQLEGLERRLRDLENAGRLEAENPSPATGSGAHDRPSPSHAAIPSDEPTVESGSLESSARGSQWESVVRDIAKRTVEDGEREREVREEERRKLRELKAIDRCAELMGLAEAQRESFRAVMLVHDAGVREVYRKAREQATGVWDSALRHSVESEIRTLKQQRDQKLAAFLWPEQIQKLNEILSPHRQPPATVKK